MLPISRQRLRWWLRGEKALGLTFVHTRGRGLLPSDAHADAVAEAPIATLPTERAGVNPVSAVENFRPASTFDPQPTTTAARRDSGRREVETGGELPAAATSPVVQPAQALFRPVGTEPFTSAELSPDEKAARLAAMDEQYVQGCRKCPLSATRRNTVFGEGDPDAKLMFIGEGPGFNEDQTGRPFVGKAGQKLDEMIVAMGFTRDQIYICNVVKCRAYIPGPGAKDRPPLPEEAAACMPYLERQIEIVRPRVVVTLGLSAMQYLLGVKQSMSRMRGNWQAWRGIPVMPTFHPSYILRNYTTEIRRAVWEDLKAVKAKLAEQQS